MSKTRKISDAQLHSMARGDNPFTPRFIMKPDAEGNIYWQKWDRDNGRVKINKWLVWIDREVGKSDDAELWTVEEFWRAINK